MSESNLQSHLNSSKHRALDVTCCGRECTVGFVSRSAMILHLEAGTCVSGLNRRAVDDNARRLDRRNVITRSADDIVRRYAADGSFNADTLRCNLCRETFGTRRALEQHLASPRHRDKMYFCPYNSCQVHFSTLSALCQHIESKRCGVRRLTSVKKILKRIIVQMGRQTSTDDESN
ncbi:hypothetical protein H0H81_005092 [Sphagnurus paluster]|uniref:C2H2-type domain-containing protein n=1 Tax=Sphagnurus paluster TaxID=117069 RepID=A0A9P7GLQ1_9AGAR|nr:hypothetical protein H0H81_005092 [Sphagnurus paluster]